MKTFAVAAALAGLAIAAPSSVAPGIAPKASAPAGCSPSYSGSFEISVAKTSKKRANLVLTLQDGILKDAEGRYGYIASNDQFQFDNPIQAGAIYTGGWSVCNNGTLALGGSTEFFECLSGTFYNLYDKDVADQCIAIDLDIVPISGSGVSQASDGQPTAASAYTSVHTVLCQITDGQVQQNTCLTTVTYTPPAVITQISDGQIQNPTGLIVTQITDGQPQVPTVTPKVVSQISDGQPQAPTATPKVVSQISDGQPQAPTATPAVVTQITDGQVQATSAPVKQSSVAVVSQITDGQVQVGTVTATPTATSPAIYTGAAAAMTMRVEVFGLAAGLAALAVL